MEAENSKCYLCDGEAKRWDYYNGSLRVECSSCKRRYELSLDIRNLRMDKEQAQLFCEEFGTCTKMPLNGDQKNRLTIYVDMNPKNEDFVNFDLDLYDILTKEF